ncbi:MAG: hypothetical protein NVSMB62_16230 [Acidobacteriaceae bacterium]
MPEVRPAPHHDVLTLHQLTIDELVDAGFRTWPGIAVVDLGAISSAIIF